LSSPKSKKALDHLTICQIEASRSLSAQHSNELSSVVFLQDIKCQASVKSTPSMSMSASNNDLASVDDADTHLSALEEDQQLNEVGVWA
jgi:hypothetical protein